MNTNAQDPKKKSQLIHLLREGVAVVQMVLFKELRNRLSQKLSDKDTAYQSLLTGAIVNEIFTTHNPEKKFQTFRQDNLAIIEQELLRLHQNLPHLRPSLTDALRVQTLCDQQEGSSNSKTLLNAEELGILIQDRELPLPSTFMTRIRRLGEQHGLTVAPVQITEEDDTLIH